MGKEPIGGSLVFTYLTTYFFFLCVEVSRTTPATPPAITSTNSIVTIFFALVEVLFIALSLSVKTVILVNLFFFGAQTLFAHFCGCTDPFPPPCPSPYSPFLLPVLCRLREKEDFI